MGDLVYIGSCSGRFYALDRNDGRLRWSQDVRPVGRPTSFHGDPIVVGGLIVIGTDAGTQPQSRNNVWAFAQDSGAVRWQLPLAQGIVSDIVAEGTRGYAITRSDSLLCVDLQTGAPVWSFAEPKPMAVDYIYRSPVVVGGRVFVSSGEGHVDALAAASGDPLWSRSLGKEISTGILWVHGELVLADASGAVHRLDPASGATLGTVAIGRRFVGAPAAVGDSLVLLTGPDGIACFDPAAGRVVWSHDLQVSSGRPCIRGDVVLVASVTGVLVAYRADDGAPLWSHPFKGIIRTIGQDEQMLYLGTQEGMIYAYQPAGR